MLEPRSVATQPETATGLDRALSLFTDVRPGEAVTALLLLANIAPLALELYGQPYTIGALSWIWLAERPGTIVGGLG